MLQKRKNKEINTTKENVSWAQVEMEVCACASLFLLSAFEKNKQRNKCINNRIKNQTFWFTFRAYQSSRCSTDGYVIDEYINSGASSDPPSLSSPPLPTSHPHNTTKANKGSVLSNRHILDSPGWLYINKQLGHPKNSKQDLQFDCSDLKRRYRTAIAAQAHQTLHKPKENKANRYRSHRRCVMLMEEGKKERRKSEVHLTCLIYCKLLINPFRDILTRMYRQTHGSVPLWKCSDVESSSKYIHTHLASKYLLTCIFCNLLWLVRSHLHMLLPLLCLLENSVACSRQINRRRIFWSIHDSISPLAFLFSC